MSSLEPDDDLPCPPAQPWGRLWGSAALLTALLIAVAATSFRQPDSPHRIELDDSAQFWGDVRARVRSNDPRQIILLGDSRMQCDLAPEALAAELGCEPPLQLGVGGATPIPTLRHIAEESEFSGVVLCSVIPYFFFNTAFFSGGAQQNYIDAWNARNTDPVTQWIFDPLRSARASIRLRKRIANLRFTDLRQNLEGNPLNANRYWEVLPDRSVANHFERARDLKSLCEAWAGGARSCPVPPISEEAMTEEFTKIERWVRRIIDRGGQVIFLRLPVSGLVLEAELDKFPLHDYWRRFAASSSASFVDFADYPATEGFTCPDGSHLDAKDRVPFSEALASVLKDVIRQPASPK